MADLPEQTAEGFEPWIHHQMWNWSNWCWDGPWPHPLPVMYCGSAERYYRPPRADDDENKTRVRKVNVENALIVNGIYESLPKVEQRIVQFEYCRRYEFDEFNFRGDLIRNVRLQKGCKILGIKQVYFQVALGNMLDLVRKTFSSRKL